MRLAGAGVMLALWASATLAAPLTVRITPHDFVVPVGGSQPLTIDARDANNAPVRGTVEWSVRPPSAGRIGSDNVFVAGPAAGEAVLRASFTGGGRTTTAWAHVRIGGQRGRLSRSILVTPRQARLATSGTQVFTAQSLDGSALAGALTWRVIPPSAGQIDAGGQFTAGATPAQCQVVALARDASGRPVGVGAAHVAIVAGAANAAPGALAAVDASLRIVPAHALLAPGDARTFAVTLPPAARGTTTVTWSVQPPSLGTIGPDGTFTASPDASGSGIVVATVSGPNGRSKRAAAAVQIAQNGARQLTLTPVNRSLPAGQSLQFQITGLSAVGAQAARVEWRVTPENAGTISGTGPIAVFTAANRRGVARVEARVSGPRGGQRTLATNVTIIDPSRRTDVAPLVSIEGSGSAQTGKPSFFRLVPQGGSASDLSSVDIVWSVAPANAGEIVAVAGRRGTAKFTPAIPGSAVITATVTFDAMTRTVAKEVIVTR